MKRRFRRWGLAGALAVVLGLGLTVHGWLRADGDHSLRIRGFERHALSDDIELVEATLVRGTVDSGRLVALFAKPTRIAPILHINDAKRPIVQIAPGATLSVNAGFFTEEYRATGLLAFGGTVLHPFVPTGGFAGSGVLVLEDKVTLWPRDRVTKETYETARLAIQAGPRVIEPGGVPGIRSDDGARANRTLIGADRRGFLALAVIYHPDGGNSRGPTLFETQTLLGPKGLGQHDAELAFDFALNLDGGPSTGLHIRAPGHQIDLPEQNRVYSVLSFKTLESSP